MSGIFIDASQLRAIQAELGATEVQYLAAYNKAVRQTSARLTKMSAALLMDVTGAKGAVRKRRVKSFVTKANAGKGGGGKIWFGLDDIPVSSLKGSMRQPRKVARQRDQRGRFVKGRTGPRGATFTPRSERLSAISFPGSFIGTIHGKRSIWIRNDDGFLTEAKVPVYPAMTSAIGKGLYSQAGEMLLDYFSKDLRGRIAGGVK